MFTPDPAEWPRYAGSYFDAYNIGAVEVSAYSSSIAVSMPELDRAGIPYEKELIPTSPDNFIWRVQGYSMQATFIAGDDGTPTYFRTRPAVATRVSTARAAAPAPAFDRARFVRALREEAANAPLVLPRH